MKQGNLLIVHGGAPTAVINSSLYGAVTEAKKHPEVEKVLGAVGGTGALIGRSIKTAEVIAYEDLGTEAVRRLTVERLPLTVVIDTLGNNLYELGPRRYLESLE